jgi:hypothetical protein
MTVFIMDSRDILVPIDFDSINFSRPFKSLRRVLIGDPEVKAWIPANNPRETTRGAALSPERNRGGTKKSKTGKKMRLLQFASQFSQ